MTKHINGFYEQDRIHIPPNGIDNWSENLLVWGHDPVAGLSFWTHMSRMTHNPEIWEGVAYVLLPDGDVLVHRSFGTSRTECVVNQEYRYTPVVPGKTWHYRFSGMAQRAKSTDLAQRMIDNEPHEPVSYDLIFDGVHPIFDFAGDDMAEQDWATMHLEQGGTIRGIMTVKGKNHYINCTGYRDHSVGPRTNAVLLSETWAHVVFPSGRCFSGLQITEEGHKNPLRAGYIYEDGQMKSLKPTLLPELNDANGNPTSFQVEGSCGERTVKLSGEMTGPYMVMTLLVPIGIGSGFDFSSPELTGVVEAPAVFNWDGETGYGWIERIRRVEALK